MAALIETKERLVSTRDTHKITKSLQLVAASRMKQYQKRAVASRKFSEEILKQVRLLSDHEVALRFSEPRLSGKRLFVLITSNKGLCGNLNHRTQKKLFQSPLWLETPEDERMLITVGKKSTDSARRMGIVPYASFPTILETIDPLKTLEVVEQILAPWLDETCREVFLVHPRYISPFVNEPMIQRYLPYAAPLREQGSTEAYLPVYLEPSPEEVAETLWHQFIQMIFMSGFYEMKASEYSSRMVAMKKATDAAQDMIETLTLELNKARQARITQELAELAGASLAEEGESEEESDLKE